MVSLETINEIGSEEASRLLTAYADLKMKEAETLQDMVALIRADDLGPRQCYEIIKHVTKMEGDIPEIAQVREEFDYESVKLILAAGVRMKQVYDVNMRQRKKTESLVSVAKRFNVSKSRLYEMTAGHKIGRPGKGVPKQEELDTPADTQTTAQVVKRQTDELGNNQSTKRQKGETSSTKKGGIALVKWCKGREGSKEIKNMVKLLQIKNRMRYFFPQTNLSENKASHHVREPVIPTAPIDHGTPRRKSLGSPPDSELELVKPETQVQVHALPKASQSAPKQSLADEEQLTVPAHRKFQ